MLGSDAAWSESNSKQLLCNCSHHSEHLAERSSEHLAEHSYEHSSEQIAVRLDMLINYV